MILVGHVDNYSILETTTYMYMYMYSIAHEKQFMLNEPDRHTVLYCRTELKYWRMHLINGYSLFYCKQYILQ